MKYGLKPFFTTRQQTIINQLNAIGLDENDPDPADLKLFPNPAEDWLTIMPGKITSDLVKVRIIDFSGKIRGEYLFNDPSGNKITLPVQDLSAGIYLLQMESGGNLFQSKFIKK